MAKVKVSEVMEEVNKTREELQSVVNDVNNLFVNVNKCSIDNQGTNDRIDMLVTSTDIEISGLKKRVTELEAKVTESLKTIGGISERINTVMENNKDNSELDKYKKYDLNDFNQLKLFALKNRVTELEDKVTEALKTIGGISERINTVMENNIEAKKDNSELDKYKKFDLNDFNQLKLFAGLIVSEVYKELEDYRHNHIPQQGIDSVISFTVNYVMQAVSMSNKDILKSDDNLRIKEYLDNVKKYAKHAMSICLGQITHNAWYNNPYVNWNMGFNPYYKF